MKVLTWMGEHPILTFFLACIIADCIVRTAAALRR